ncbi:MAG: DUF4258 domain-containing protein [Thermodesulfovibrionales bacterium]
MVEFYFKVKTPLNVEIRTTIEYWQYLVTKKHPVMKDKENIVKGTLQYPDEIRQSKIDKNIFLYYRQFDKLYCAVVKHIQKEGFLITAYPVDKMKEGERIWTKY